MAKILVTTPEAEKGFYPTPPAIAEKLLEGINWDKVKDVLEPSAGKGNLVDAIAEKKALRRYGYHDRLCIDCIEIDPALRVILLSGYGEAQEDALWERIREIQRKERYCPETRRTAELSQEDKVELRHLEFAKDVVQSVNVRIVHDDFLTFESRKRYDLIVMNPPFADGDKHLLKAISLAQRHGCSIRCVLNAETLRNPFCLSRKVLAEKLADYGAEITFVENGFVDAERATDVEVAIIKLEIPAPDYANDTESLYQRMKKAAMLPEEESEVTDLAITDFLEGIVQHFNFEVDAGLRLIREYNAMKPYILSSLKESKYSKVPPTLSLSVLGENSNPASPNAYLIKVRQKYWEALLMNEKFIGQLTSNLREKYQGMVEELAHYDFTMFNIRKILLEMKAEMSQGVIDTILALFEKCTQEHSYYPECSKNIHYFNGWKTNKAHKINKKVILPAYGVFSSWKKGIDTYTAYKLLTDIEKALNYLDGNMTLPVDLQWAVERASNEGRTSLACKFFDVTFYKKGTMHIKFTNMELLDRFNIYCARQRGWLPPSYGNVKYTDMEVEEKAVVDGFHGDGTNGSGQKGYDEVVARAGYYLAPANHAELQLTA